MSTDAVCRCCLLRPPDKDLKSEYSRLGKSEIFADMLRECFEIHVPYDDDEYGSGICDTCVARLRDACDFKLQVQTCALEMLVPRARREEQLVKDEKPPVVKDEIPDPDEDNGLLFLQLKEEMSSFDEDEEDSKSLAEMLAFSGVVKKKKRSAKKLLEKSERKAKKLLQGGLKLYSHLESLEKVHIISENKQHKANVDNILRYSNSTPFSNKTLSGIVCAYCKETYADLPDLRLHTLEKHKDDELHDNKRMDKNNLSIKMDITDLTCNICNAKLDNISILKKHLTNEHGIKFYSDVNDYILEFKLSESEMLNCALCNSTYETFKMLLQHMNGHYRNYICEVCDMGFINKHRLKNHQRTHELGTFKCAYCEKVFSTRVRKACHEKYTHNTNARYTTNCPQCNESFTSYYQRNRHMFKEHNTSAATYKCNICDKSFILKSKLTSHIKKVHLMERNHICAECGQGFFIKQSLDEHMVKHNGERVFKCTVCHKAYARKKTLREHMRIHNNDRRFKCGVCGYAFVQKCSLKSHMLSNHGITLSEYETARNSMSSIK